MHPVCIISLTTKEVIDMPVTAVVRAVPLMAKLTPPQLLALSGAVIILGAGYYYYKQSPKRAKESDVLVKAQNEYNAKVKMKEMELADKDKQRAHELKLKEMEQAHELRLKEMEMLLKFGTGSDGSNKYVEEILQRTIPEYSKKSGRALA